MRFFDKNKSIVILNIKMGVKNKSIKSIFSKYGKIIKFKSKVYAKNKMLMAFIEFKHDESAKIAVQQSREIICCNIPLTVRMAYHQTNSSELNITNQTVEDSLIIKLDKEEEKTIENMMNPQEKAKKKCKCTKCTDLRLTLIKSRLNEILSIYDKIKDKQKRKKIPLEYYKSFSLKLLETGAKYCDIVTFYEHN